jgi:hypothetical protein
MKNRITILGALGLAWLCLHTAAFAQTTNSPAPADAQKREHVWWRDGAPGLRPYTVDNKKMPLISVKGNKFVDPDGKTVLFRGLAISDPDKLEMQGHWSKDYFVKVKELGAKLVRIPVHPVAWRERTPPEYLKLLDQAVGWCTELDLYLEGKGISWTVWCFDPEWGPTLIRNWNYELSPSGEFAKAALNGEINSTNEPGKSKGNP